MHVTCKFTRLVPIRNSNTNSQETGDSLSCHITPPFEKACPQACRVCQKKITLRHSLPYRPSPSCPALQGIILRHKPPYRSVRSGLLSSPCLHIGQAFPSTGQSSPVLSPPLTDLAPRSGKGCEKNLKKFSSLPSLLPSSHASSCLFREIERG